MLKTSDITLDGRDAGKVVRLTELPALVADRAARVALLAVDADSSGGVVALAMQHAATVRGLGARGLDLLMPFVRGQIIGARGGTDGTAFDVRRHLRDWRNVQRIQDAALLLHAGFIVSREQLEIPVTLQAQSLLQGVTDIRATFCSPHIAAAIQSRHCTYRDVEDTLSTEDVWNIVELINVDALRDFHLQQNANQQR
jgi:hypothetical protein